MLIKHLVGIASVRGFKLLTALNPKPIAAKITCLGLANQESRHYTAANLTPMTKIITSNFLNGEDPSPELGIIILNWKLPSITPRLLEKAAFFICADGGANRLHDEVPFMVNPHDPSFVRSTFLPHLIKGDLDSIRPEVLEYYRSQGVPVVDLSADQDSTDLQKCIKYIQDHKMTSINAKGQPQEPIQTLLVLGAHGGRLDHILANLSTLHTFRELDIVLCGDGNLTRLIPQGKVLIKTNRELEGPSCGLVPLLGPAVASSSGLRWNLDATEMRIGGLVSTSNIIEADEIEVESSIDLIWTTELREQKIAP